MIFFNYFTCKYNQNNHSTIKIYHVKNKQNIITGYEASIFLSFDTKDYMNPTEAIEDQKKLKTAKINLAGKNVKKAQIIAAKSIGNKQYPKTQTD